MIAAVVAGKLARASHGARATCPECRGSVYARMPEHAIRHWAHTPLPDGETHQCSRDSGEMSEWHRKWQFQRTDLQCIEVVGEGHRADVINAGGIVIEFQRSSITPEDVTARERYWRKGVWVLDGTPNEEGEERVELRRHPDQPENDPYRSFHWPRAPLLLYRAKWPLWIDLGKPGLLQVRHAAQSRGGGWVVEREWFIDEVINGSRMTLRTHTVSRPKTREARKRIGQARQETEEDLSDLPINCNRPVWASAIDAPCCGMRYPAVAGDPLVLACQLCPASPIYWRRA